MDNPLTNLSIGVTKPKSKLARRLAESGIRMEAVPPNEGNVDRFFISKRVAIDYRKANAFANGIMDKSVFTSAIYLREHFALPILIVEGEVNYGFRHIDPQAVRGALSSMVLEYGLSVLHAQDLDDSVELLTMIARQEQVGIPEISLVPKRTANSLADMQRRVAEMLPGCGRVMARELLQKFGSIEELVHASASQLRQVRGIGAKKAKTMQKVMSAEYKAIDTERQVEDAIEAAPSLLFKRRKVELVARQHQICGDQEQRQIIDLIYYDECADTLYLVELKRAELKPSDRAQLRRYLREAHRSPLINGYLKQGSTLRGILASPLPSELKERKDTDIEVRTVNARGVIKFLCGRRASGR